MGLKSIKINNLLSFDNFVINDFKDINCIIGKNNSGKSNLLKLIDYFYKKMDGEQAIPPKLNSEYTPTGSISLGFDITRLKKVVTSNRKKSDYQRHIYNTLFTGEFNKGFVFPFAGSSNFTEKQPYIEVTLTIRKDDSIFWSIKDHEILKIISRVYPFFSIDTRKIELYDWRKLWSLISKVKFLNTRSLKKEDVVNFLNDKISAKSGSYKDYIEKIDDITERSDYSYQERVLNYVKVGLGGQNFNIDGMDLEFHSDGTNSHKYLELFLSLIIALTRREFVTPSVYIDEPEIGLHPKRNEELIYRLHEIYFLYKKNEERKQKNKYATPYPKIIFSTHSPNIVKQLVRLFEGEEEHQLLHFSKKKKASTKVTTLNTHFPDKRFINIFSDNEARLFFSDYILFVEGETELEIFGNQKLMELFPRLRLVDTYKTNKVMLNSINPRSANVAIPYLVIYDADKLLKYDFPKSTLTFRNDTVDLYELAKPYKFSIYGSKKYTQGANIKYLISHDKNEKNSNEDKTDYEIFKYNEFIKRINITTLRTLNTYFFSTTIEGALINKKTIKVFYKWLFNEYLYTACVGGSGDVNKTIDTLYPKLGSHMNIKQVFKSIFKFPPFRGKLTTSSISKSRKVRVSYIKDLIVQIEALQLTEDELITIFRLVFNGKTNLLEGRDNENYQYVSDKISNAVTLISNELNSTYPHKIAKTGGWVTSFINFSFNYLIKMTNKNQTNLQAEFENTFMELSVILKKVSASIE
ncbi:retron Eco8 family effector endonuclease [Pseudoalteromonas sp. Angola-4]|uniref:retron Eco8 family effector endonuclease n=1 Tax=Pseudoalteromonas sp. Angola-4 TaxID=3025335 RepID=UPI002359F195|nr:retron Eco8 family effector endonuclease [Pseudoalteromonas sp. Angola-4]MDC9509914.1 retron Eco8 family effector endonuclease [Pseudoalteromonas sp. Angola-4]